MYIETISCVNTEKAALCSVWNGGNYQTTIAFYKQAGTVQLTEDEVHYVMYATGRVKVLEKRGERCEACVVCNCSDPAQINEDSLCRKASLELVV